MSAAVVEKGLRRRPKVRWGRIASFYGLAFGWVCLIAAGLYLVGSRDLSGGQGPSLVTAVLAFLYMPAPLVAALVVERLDRRPAALRTVFSGLLRKLPKIAAVSFGLIAALLVAMLALSWVLGNVADTSGVGRVAYRQDDLVANLLVLFGSMDAAQVAALSASLPPLWLMLLLTYVGAMVAGLTVNGLFAFGEEYGWRGWLADELRPLGAFWANVITGILWGIWHGPLILMGFNYAGYEKYGTAFMIAFCVPMSFLLWRAREVTGSVVAAAVIHGAFNGFAGIFAIILANANPIVAAPMGMVGAIAIAIVAALFWLITRKRAGRAG